MASSGLRAAGVSCHGALGMDMASGGLGFSTLKGAVGNTFCPCLLFGKVLLQIQRGSGSDPSLRSQWTMGEQKAMLEMVTVK